MEKIEKNKEYYFATGRHAAIVRKGANNKLEYLELQSKFDYLNKWTPFEENTLTKRFGLKRDKKLHILALADISSFFNNKGFIDLMDFINTAPEKQKKGNSGKIK